MRGEHYIAWCLFVLWLYRSIGGGMTEPGGNRCIRCRYSIPHHAGAQYSRCSRFLQKTPPIDVRVKQQQLRRFLVDGIPAPGCAPPSYELCSVARERESLCGAEGKYYETRF